MDKIKEQKKAFRREVKAKIATISSEDKQLRAEQIFKQVSQIPDFQISKNILMFWSLPDEIFTHKAVLEFSKEKTVILPITVGDDLVFSRFSSLADMTIGNFGIAEPNIKDRIDTSLIDFAIIPGVAFDKSNNRMGRGRGFYDRILNSISAKKVGVCLREQYFEAIPTEDFDKKMDYVIFA